VREERRDRFMAKAAEISARKLEAKIGRVLDVIVDEADPQGGATARSKADAPEIDGRVLLRDAHGAKPGDILSVMVEDADAFDLFGVPVA
jgi:ribosomal protein S12 methylthiotransferase